MQTFKFKLMQSRRNRKLHRQISAAGLAWNHCVALTRRYYKLFGKSVSKFDLQKHPGARPDTACHRKSARRFKPVAIENLYHART